MLSVKSQIHEVVPSAAEFQVAFQFELSMQSCRWLVAFITTIFIPSNKLSVDTDFSSTLSNRKQEAPHLESLKIKKKKKKKKTFNEYLVRLQ